MKFAIVILLLAVAGCNSHQEMCTFYRQEYSRRTDAIDSCLVAGAPCVLRPTEFEWLEYYRSQSALYCGK